MIMLPREQTLRAPFACVNFRRRWAKARTAEAARVQNLGSSVTDTNRRASCKRSRGAPVTNADPRTAFEQI